MTPKPDPKNDGQEPLVDRAARIRVRLQHFMDRAGYSQAALARGMAITSPHLGRFLAGDAASSNQQMCDRIEAFFDLEMSRQDSTILGGWAETAIAVQIIQVATACHRLSAMGLVEGPSGIGKTQAALEFARRVNCGLIVYVRARPSSTANELLRDVYLAMRRRGAVPLQKRGLQDELRGALTPNHMLIVDQFHDCRPSCVEELMALHDLCQMSVLLIGTARVWDLLEGGGGWQHEQMLDRLTVHLHLLPGKSGFFSAEDVARVAALRADGLSADAVTWLAEEANKRGSLRMAMRVLQLALDSVGGDARAVTPKTLAGMRKITPGNRADTLLRR